MRSQRHHITGDVGQPLQHIKHATRANRGITSVLHHADFAGGFWGLAGGAEEDSSAGTSLFISIPSKCAWGHCQFANLVCELMKVCHIDVDFPSRLGDEQEVLRGCNIHSMCLQQSKLWKGWCSHISSPWSPCHIHLDATLAVRSPS